MVFLYIRLRYVVDMPELPEVEIVKRALEPSIREKCVEKLVFNRPNLRFPLPQNLPQKLEGQRLQKIERRGKYIVVFAENGAGFDTGFDAGRSGLGKADILQNIENSLIDHFDISIRERPI